MATIVQGKRKKDNSIELALINAFGNISATAIKKNSRKKEDKLRQTQIDVEQKRIDEEIAKNAKEAENRKRGLDKALAVDPKLFDANIAFNGDIGNTFSNYAHEDPKTLSSEDVKRIESARKIQRFLNSIGPKLNALSPTDKENFIAGIYNNATNLVDAKGQAEQKFQQLTNGNSLFLSSKDTASSWDRYEKLKGSDALKNENSDGLVKNIRKDMRRSKTYARQVQNLVLPQILSNSIALEERLVNRESVNLEVINARDYLGKNELLLSGNEGEKIRKVFQRKIDYAKSIDFLLKKKFPKEDKKILEEISLASAFTPGTGLLDGVMNEMNKVRRDKIYKIIMSRSKVEYMTILNRKDYKTFLMIGKENPKIALTYADNIANTSQKGRKKSNSTASVGVFANRNSSNAVKFVSKGITRIVDINSLTNISNFILDINTVKKAGDKPIIANRISNNLISSSLSNWLESNSTLPELNNGNTPGRIVPIVKDMYQLYANLKAEDKLDQFNSMSQGLLDKEFNTISQIHRLDPTNKTYSVKTTEFARSKFNIDHKQAQTLNNATVVDFAKAIRGKTLTSSQIESITNNPKSMAILRRDTRFIEFQNKIAKDLKYGLRIKDKANGLSSIDIAKLSFENTKKSSIDKKLTLNDFMDMHGNDFRTTKGIMKAFKIKSSSTAAKIAAQYRTLQEN